MSHLHDTQIFSAGFLLPGQAGRKLNPDICDKPWCWFLSSNLFPRRSNVEAAGQGGSRTGSVGRGQVVVRCFDPAHCPSNRFTLIRRPCLWQILSSAGHILMSRDQCAGEPAGDVRSRPFRSPLPAVSPPPRSPWPPPGARGSRDRRAGFSGGRARAAASRESAATRTPLHSGPARHTHPRSSRKPRAKIQIDSTA